MEVSDGNLRVHQIHSEIVSDATAEISEVNAAHTTITQSTGAALKIYWPNP